MSIFNKNYSKEAADACQYLSILRPELIVPSIIEKLILRSFFFLDLLKDLFLDYFHRLII